MAEQSSVAPRAGRYAKRFTEVLGHRMAYIEAGVGDPIVFLHGNPTHSYLWREVIPHLEGLGRCIAPDLIGMGDSDRLDSAYPDRYRFVEHRRYLDALFEILGVRDNVTFVGHDWGGALAFDWANRNRDAVKGLAYCDTLVHPTVGDVQGRREMVKHLRTPEGERFVLEDNGILERFLAGGVLREMPEEDLAEYRRPWTESGENRRAMLVWPQAVPVDGEPAENYEIIDSYARWLAESPLPKLFVRASDGMIGGEHLEFCRSWPNQTEVTVVARHFVQEDAPDAVGQAIAEWHRGLG